MKDIKKTIMLMTPETFYNKKYSFFVPSSKGQIESFHTIAMEKFHNYHMQLPQLRRMMLTEESR